MKTLTVQLYCLTSNNAWQSQQTITLLVFTLKLVLAKMPKGIYNSNMKIIHIDDDDLILEHFGYWMNNAGFEHISLRNPFKAVDTIRQVKPNAILMDIVMPDINGIDLLKKIKNEQDIAQIPVLFLTYMPYELSGPKAKELGAYAYLSKDHYNSDSLRDILVGLL